MSSPWYVSLRSVAPNSVTMHGNRHAKWKNCCPVRGGKLVQVINDSKCCRLCFRYYVTAHDVVVDVLVVWKFCG